MKYSIDTNALINLWRRRYPREIFPGIWNNLELLVKQGELIASEEVFCELEKVDDEDTLLMWAKENKMMFISMNEEIQLAVRSVLSSHPGMINVKKNQSGADPFVVAVAKVYNGIVITDENFTNNLERPKIPDVCRNLGIRCLNLIEFFKQQGWSFN